MQIKPLQKGELQRVQLLLSSENPFLISLHHQSAALTFPLSEEEGFPLPVPIYFTYSHEDSQLEI